MDQLPGPRRTKSAPEMPPPDFDTHADSTLAQVSAVVRPWRKCDLCRKQRQYAPQALSAPRVFIGTCRHCSAGVCGAHAVQTRRGLLLCLDCQFGVF
jgi:hypothetical protein